MLTCLGLDEAQWKDEEPLKRYHPKEYPFGDAPKGNTVNQDFPFPILFHPSAPTLLQN